MEAEGPQEEIERGNNGERMTSAAWPEAEVRAKRWSGTVSSKTGTKRAAPTTTGGSWRRRKDRGPAFSERRKPKRWTGAKSNILKPNIVFADREECFLEKKVVLLDEESIKLTLHSL